MINGPRQCSKESGEEREKERGAEREALSFGSFRKLKRTNEKLLGKRKIFFGTGRPEEEEENRNGGGKLAPVSNSRGVKT